MELSEDEENERTTETTGLFHYTPSPGFHDGLRLWVGHRGHL